MNVGMGDRPMAWFNLTEDIEALFRSLMRCVDLRRHSFLRIHYIDGRLGGPREAARKLAHHHRRRREKLSALPSKTHRVCACGTGFVVETGDYRAMRRRWCKPTCDARIRGRRLHERQMGIMKTAKRLADVPLARRLTCSCGTEFEFSVANKRNLRRTCCDACRYKNNSKRCTALTRGRP